MSANTNCFYSALKIGEKIGVKRAQEVRIPYKCQFLLISRALLGSIRENPGISQPQGAHAYTGPIRHSVLRDRLGLMCLRVSCLFLLPWLLASLTFFAFSPLHFLFFLSLSILFTIQSVQNNMHMPLIKLMQSFHPFFYLICSMIRSQSHFGLISAFSFSFLPTVQRSKIHSTKNHFFHCIHLHLFCAVHHKLCYRVRDKNPLLCSFRSLALYHQPMKSTN